MQGIGVQPIAEADQVGLVLPDRLERLCEKFRAADLTPQKFRLGVKNE